jgi:UDP-glucose 4-epimerase
LVRERTGSSSEIVYLPYERAYGPDFEDMVRRVPSLEKLQRLIGYRPCTPLEDIIDAVAAHMVGTLHEEASGFAASA